jgi:1-deoxy-D-xylulose-5-phosphate reductoisomerase
MIALAPTLEAIRCGKSIALATKEILVSAGELVLKEAKNNNVRLVPIDSEHSAIMQCLQGNKQEVSKVILTASGGPFRGKIGKILRILPQLRRSNTQIGAWGERFQLTLLL